jgi:hypothetical protein
MNLPKGMDNGLCSLRLGRKITVEGKKWDARYGGLTLHDLRRSAVRNLINAGFDSVLQCRLQDTKLVQSLTAITSLRLSMSPTEAGG